MERKSVFTKLAKYSVIGIVLLIVLSGCQNVDSAITPESTGFFNHYFIYPFSYLIKGLASVLGGAYGLSIIILTIAIRLCLMPLMLRQTKGSMQMRDKMNMMKPELDALKEKYKDKKDKEAQMKLQQETMELYKKHGMNPLASIGCLPIIIQFPIIIAFYYAIRRTPEIAQHSLLWFNLGQPDMILPFIAAGVYYLQARVTLIGMDEKQKKQMGMMSYISPIMIFIVSFNFPSALPLYWVVSGSFVVIQTLLAKKLYMKKDEETVVSTS